MSVSTLNQKTVTATFTVSTGVYAAGDAIGTANAPFEITGVFNKASQTATLLRGRLIDPEAQVGAKAINLLLFNANPTGTFTDNGPLAIAGTELVAKHQATCRFAADAGAVYDTLAAASMASQLRTQPITAGATTSLWVVCYTTDNPDWVTGVVLTALFDIALNG